MAERLKRRLIAIQDPLLQVLISLANKTTYTQDANDLKYQYLRLDDKDMKIKPRSMKEIEKSVADPHLNPTKLSEALNFIVSGAQTRSIHKILGNNLNREFHADSAQMLYPMEFILFTHQLSSHQYDELTLHNQVLERDLMSLPVHFTKAATAEDKLDLQFKFLQLDTSDLLDSKNEDSRAYHNDIKESLLDGFRVNEQQAKSILSVPDRKVWLIRDMLDTKPNAVCFLIFEEVQSPGRKKTTLLHGLYIRTNERYAGHRLGCYLINEAKRKSIRERKPLYLDSVESALNFYLKRDFTTYEQAKRLQQWQHSLPAPTGDGLTQVLFDCNLDNYDIIEDIRH
jgi:hypothetical protein